MCEVILPRILANQICAIQEEGVLTSWRVYGSCEQVVVTMRFGVDSGHDTLQDINSSSISYRRKPPTVHQRDANRLMLYNHEKQKQVEDKEMPEEHNKESQMNNIVQSPVLMDVEVGENQSCTVQVIEAEDKDNPQTVTDYDKRDLNISSDDGSGRLVIDSDKFSGSSVGSISESGTDLVLYSPPDDYVYMPTASVCAVLEDFESSEEIEVNQQKQNSSSDQNKVSREQSDEESLSELSSYLEQKQKKKKKVFGECLKRANDFLDPG